MAEKSVSSGDALVARQERVLRLRAAIQAGTYRPDNDLVASAIYNRMLAKVHEDAEETPGDLSGEGSSEG